MNHIGNELNLQKNQNILMKCTVVIRKSDPQEPYRDNSRNIL
jgi:hypothetical protein